MNGKRMLAALLTLCLFAFAGCGAPKTAPEAPAADAAQPVTVRLAGLKGPTSMGMVKLLNDAECGETKTHCEFQMAASADELTPKLLKGELDVLALPSNLAAILYETTGGGIRMLAVSTLGVISIVQKGEKTVSRLEDLRGRTIYATGKNSMPEFALRYLLAQHGISMDSDVNVQWKSEPAEAAALLEGDESAVAMLPQPFVTAYGMKMADLGVVLDLTKEWDALENGSQFVSAVLAVRTEFLEAHPETVRDLLTDYAASVSFVREHPKESSELIEKYGIVGAAVAEKALPYCNPVCLTGEEMAKVADGWFRVLYGQNPASVGGKLPDEAFYAKDF